MMVIIQLGCLHLVEFSFILCLMAFFLLASFKSNMTVYLLVKLISVIQSFQLETQGPLYIEIPCTSATWPFSRGKAKMSQVQIRRAKSWGNVLSQIDRVLGGFLQKNLES